MWAGVTHGGSDASCAISRCSRGEQSQRFAPIAGAVFVALLAGGVSPSRLLPPSLTGAQPAESWILTELICESSYDPKHWLPGAPLGSWRLALAGVLQPLSNWSVLQVLSGIAPAGRVSAEPIVRTIRRAVARGWAPHPKCLIVATDYASGKHVVFGEKARQRQASPKQWQHRVPSLDTSSRFRSTVVVTLMAAFIRFVTICYERSSRLPPYGLLSREETLCVSGSGRRRSRACPALK